MESYSNPEKIGVDPVGFLCYTVKWVVFALLDTWSSRKSFIEKRLQSKDTSWSSNVGSQSHSGVLLFMLGSQWLVLSIKFGSIMY